MNIEDIIWLERTVEKIETKHLISPDEMEDVEGQISPALQAKLEAKKLYHLLGLSAHQVSIIEQEAERNQTDIRHLIAHWVLEQIQSIPLSSSPSR